MPPPAQGQAEVSIFNGKQYKYCSKCQKWNTAHRAPTTSEHHPRHPTSQQHMAIHTSGLVLGSSTTNNNHTPPNITSLDNLATVTQPEPPEVPPSTLTQHI